MTSTFTWLLCVQCMSYCRFAVFTTLKVLSTTDTTEICIYFKERICTDSWVSKVRTRADMHSIVACLMFKYVSEEKRKPPLIQFTKRSSYPTPTETLRSLKLYHFMSPNVLHNKQAKEIHNLSWRYIRVHFSKIKEFTLASFSNCNLLSSHIHSFCLKNIKINKIPFSLSFCQSNIYDRSLLS